MEWDNPTGGKTKITFTPHNEQPRIERSKEIRCPACKPLGWSDAHLLMIASPYPGALASLEVETRVISEDLQLQIKCPRCKSILICKIVTFDVIIKEQGKRFIQKV